MAQRDKEMKIIYCQFNCHNFLLSENIHFKLKISIDYPHSSLHIWVYNLVVYEKKLTSQASKLISLIVN